LLLAASCLHGITTSGFNVESFKEGYLSYANAVWYRRRPNSHPHAYFATYRT
jgi:hypothetical protein